MPSDQHSPPAVPATPSAHPAPAAPAVPATPAAPAAAVAPPAAVELPPFPEVPGHDRLSDHDKAGIANAAWEHAKKTAGAAAGDIELFNKLIADHVAGAIDLFRMPDKPAAPAG